MQRRPLANPLHLLIVPYDSGQRNARMGRGAAILASALGRDRGASYEQVTVNESYQVEVGTGFAVARRLATRVRAAVGAGRLPLVLAGNCLTSVGTVAGLGTGVGILWFDAHGDFHTANTTTSGFVDGTALATVTGLCWRGMTRGIAGFKPASGSHIVHVGGRAFDPGEGERMAEAGLRVLTAPAPHRWPTELRGLYVHIDLDVLNRNEVPANAYQPSGGLSIAALVEGIRMLRGEMPILAAAITSYDPAGDPQARAGAAAVAIVDSLAS